MTRSDSLRDNLREAETEGDTRPVLIASARELPMGPNSL